MERIVISMPGKVWPDGREDLAEFEIGQQSRERQVTGRPDRPDRA
jgi:hypothetical protein